MSLTTIHTRAERRRARHNSPPGEAEREFAHMRLTEFAEANEEALLRRVFAVNFPGRDFDGDRACQVVALNISAGASFHEALIETCFDIDRPTLFFHWRRNDLHTYTPKLPNPDGARRRRKASGATAAA